MREHKCNSKPLFLNGAAATPASPSNKKFWEFRNAAETGGTAELLLYGDISRTSWWGDEVTPQAFAADLATIPAMDDLTVRICSGGGDVWAAQAIGAMLENRLGTVTAQIEGICASAATIVASHCKVVKAAEDATYMIHPIKVNPNGFVDMEGLKQLMDALTVMRTNVLNQYAKKTGHTVEEVAAWMDATSWWTAAEAKENGFMGASFKVVGVSPMILINVLDPNKHKKNLPEKTVQVNDGVAVVEEKDILLDKLTVKAEETPLAAGTDYTAAFDDNGYVNIVVIPGGAGDSATSLTVSGVQIDPTAVTPADIVGAVTADGVESGMEVIRQIFPKLNMTPGILLAPGWSENALVSAGLQAKTSHINGVFNCVCIVDIDSSTAGATKYDDVKRQKEKQAVTSANCYAVWLYAKVGDVIYAGSAMAAAATVATDANNGDVPSKFEVFAVYEPKRRMVHAPAFVDKVVLHALVDNILYDALTKSFIRDSHASQTGKGTDDGLMRLKTHMVDYYRREGHGADGWVLKGDVRHFFASIDHRKLKRKLKAVLDKRGVDPRVYELLCIYIDVMEDGLPLGYQTSQLFALMFLDEFDHIIKEKYRIKYYGRYMDDFYIICSDKRKLQYILRDVRALMDSYGLELNQKTAIFPLRNGIDFLGFHSYLTDTGAVIQKLRRDSSKRMKNKIRYWETAYPAGEVTKQEILRSFDAWDAHAAHGDTYSLRRKYADRLEKLLDCKIPIHRKINSNKLARDRRRARQCRCIYKKQHKALSLSVSQNTRPAEIMPWA